MWYLNENHLLHYSQAGFQSWHNTSELLLRFTESIYAAFDKKSVSYAVLLDISSAYDSVWRDGLRFKMRNEFKLKGRLYWWLDSFLKDRIGKVVLNGISSISKNLKLEFHKVLHYHHFFSYYTSTTSQKQLNIQFNVECLQMMLHCGLQFIQVMKKKWRKPACYGHQTELK